MRISRTSRGDFLSIARRATIRAALAALACVLACGDARPELPRRISASLEPNCFILDSDFFGLSSAFGFDAALRYELASDIYFENGLGIFRSSADGTSVNGLDYHLNLLALFPVLIPYRPVARLGIGFISVNPITVTPTETFRPTQTTFYFLAGTGATRSIFDRFLLEASVNFWITPYEYRIYRFNRFSIETSDQRFTHLAISLGIVYSF